MRKSNAFTLVELMVTMVVIGILATLVLAAISRAQESANQARTKSTILKLHEIIANRWDTYRYRRIPVGTNLRDPNDPNVVLRLEAKEAAIYRTKVIRKLQRMELPDRWGDIRTVMTNYDVDGNGPATPPIQVASHPVEGLIWRDVKTGAPRMNLAVPVPIPALYYAYQTYYNTVSDTAEDENRTPTAVYEGAECLYMIVKVGGVDENDSLSSFSEQEVGDVDGDGAPEFLDAWGTPIEFIRWPVGFVDDPRQDLSADQDWHFGHLSDIQPPKQPQGVASPLVACRCDVRNRHDSFDPRQTDPFAFETFPLIYSAGPDRRYDIYHGVTGRDTLVDHGGADPTKDRYASPLMYKVASSGKASKLDSLDDPYIEIRTDSTPCNNYNPVFEVVDQDVQGSGARPKSSGMPKNLKNEPIYDATRGWLWNADQSDNRLSHFDNLHNHILDTRLR